MTSITVVVPAYNMELYLPDCIKSIVNQSELPNEVIVVDDGSSDSTSTVVSLFSKKYPFIKCIRQKNGGLCAARNTGLRHASSDYVMFLDSDDCMGEGAISKCKEIINQCAPDVIIGRIEFFTEKKKWTAKSYDDACNNERLTTFKNDPKLVDCMNVGPKCFRRAFLNQIDVWFYEGVMMTEDHWFSLNTLTKAEKIFLTTHIIFNYRRDREGASTVTNKLSYYSDMHKIQRSLATVDFENKDEYLNRLIKFDLVAYGTRPILKLKTFQEQLQAANILREIVETLPDATKNLIEGDLLEVYKSPVRFLLKKRARKFIITPFIRLYSFLNALYVKNKQHRRKCLTMMYSLLSTLPVVKKEVLFAVRPSSKMSNLQPLKDYLTVSTDIKARCIEAKQTSLANDFYLMYKLARASTIIVDGDFYFLFGLIPRKKTLVIQAWHGGGAFKKFGCDIYPKGSKNSLDQKKHHTSYGVVATSSEYVKRFYKSAFGVEEDIIKDIGLIRTDKLYEIDIQGTKQKIVEKYSLDPKKKIVLYAPTFREPNGAFNNIGDFELKIDIDKFNERFADKYYLAVRVHPNYKNSLIGKEVLDFTELPQDQALAVTDVLVTDYSSIIFDFAFFRKPIIAYAYDFLDYIKQRSFYENYQEIVPGPVVYTESELFESIESIDETKSKLETEKFWNRYMSSCDGNVCKKMADIIMEWGK